MVELAAVVGEIGLDTGSRVPLDLQLRTFRQALEIVARLFQQEIRLSISAQKSTANRHRMHA